MTLSYHCLWHLIYLFLCTPQILIYSGLLHDYRGWKQIEQAYCKINISEMALKKDGVTVPEDIFFKSQQNLLESEITWKTQFLLKQLISSHNLRDTTILDFVFNNISWIHLYTHSIYTYTLCFKFKETK